MKFSMEMQNKILLMNKVYKEQTKKELELSNWNSWKNCVDTLKMSIVNNYRIVIEKSGNIHNIIIWYIYPKTHCFFIIDVWKSEPIDIGIQKYIYVLLCTFMCPTQSHNTSKSIQEQYGSKVLLCYHTKMSRCNLLNYLPKIPSVLMVELVYWR